MIKDVIGRRLQRHLSSTPHLDIKEATMNHQDYSYRREETMLNLCKSEETDESEMT
jgi:hypothetical protein